VAALTSSTTTETCPPITILGLDLSLTGSGAVRYKLPWAGDFKDIESLHVGRKLSKDASEYDCLCRLRYLRDEILEFADGCQVVAVEQYAFSRGASRAHALGELGGVVKLALLGLGLEIVPLTASHVRSCLGKFPRKAPKEHVAALIRKLGAPDRWSDDVIDSFVTANGWSVANGYGGIVIR
jgi:Holliday junction resolvasome RuvABC endonuclease subunit